MTRYRLPEELCGADYEAAHMSDDVASFDIPGIGWVVLPRSALTEVKPALPPQPPRWSVVLDKDGVAWQRVLAADTWANTGGFEETWEEIQNYGPLTRLVPEAKS